MVLVTEYLVEPSEAEDWALRLNGEFARKKKDWRLMGAKAVVTRKNERLHQRGGTVKVYALTRRDVPRVREALPAVEKKIGL